MRVVAVIACRLNSTRLYGKPMQLVGEHPILFHLIERLRQAKAIDEIVLAISDAPGQEVFVDFAGKNDLRYVVGSDRDVLQRLIEAGEMAGAGTIVRHTSDNPFVYWENLDELIATHIRENSDLTVTEHLPIGAYVEILSLDALKTSHRHGDERHRSELCDLFIVERPEQFKIFRVPAPAEVAKPSYRLTVDTPEDLVLVRRVWAALQSPGKLISIEDIVRYLDTHPEVASLNASIEGKHIWK